MATEKSKSTYINLRTWPEYDLALLWSWTCSSTSIFDAHLHKVFSSVLTLRSLQGLSHHCQTHLNHRIQVPLLEQASRQSLGRCPTSKKKRIQLVCSFGNYFGNCSCCFTAIQGSHVFSGAIRPALDHWTHQGHIKIQKYKEIDK